MSYDDEEALMEAFSDIDEEEKEEKIFTMGDEYFCSECNGNHTKGMIYKRHLKYFLDPDTVVIDPKSSYEGSYTYIIYCSEPKAFKVGRSRNIQERLDIIQAYNPSTLRLVLAIPDESMESRLHKALKIYNIRNEWFSCNEDVIKIIEKTVEKRVLEFKSVIDRISSLKELVKSWKGRLGVE